MSEEKLDQFARGELSPSESRELAQKALDDPELFEELTYTAIASTGLPDRRRRSAWRPIAVLAAAAVLTVAVCLYAIRQFRPPVAPAVAISGSPIFLPAAGSNTVFRGAEMESRAPRATGSVMSIAGGMVTVDVGSLDGLAKDGEVEVVRDGKTAGKLKLTTIFRERARAEAPAGVIVRVNDQIRVPPAMYLGAVLDQIAASSARGDPAGARRMAEQAPVSEHIDTNASGFTEWNNLGGIAELHGDRAKARSLYERALHANPPREARVAIEANLARVKGAN